MFTSKFGRKFWFLMYYVNRKNDILGSNIDENI